jgi:chemotaxis protein MotA
MAQDKPSSNGGRAKLDVATLAGVAIAFGGILGGLILEQGKLGDIAQFSAFLIVFGGTVGATLVSTPLPLFRRALKRLKTIFFESQENPAALIDEMIGYATQARKRGLLSLEAETGTIANPFFRKALTLAVDGTDVQEIRNMLELEIALDEHRAEAEAKVFEAAGGYSPTIGIIGAVLGLIQVMRHIQNIDEVGNGIAIAFVATIYGVGLANLLLLPAAAKIKIWAQHEVQIRELVIEGVAAIAEGMNPKLVRLKLEAFGSAAPLKPAPHAPAAGLAPAGEME